MWQGDNQGDDDIFGTSLGRIKDRRGPKKSGDAKLGRKGEPVNRAKMGRNKREPRNDRRQDSDTDEAGDD